MRKIINWNPNMKTTAFILMMLLSGVVLGQQKPTTGFAPVNGLKMYYEIHGSGDNHCPDGDDFLDAKPEKH
jgi:hypothetical protein